MAFYHVYQSGAGSTSSSRIMDEPSACPGCLYAEPVTISVAQNVTDHSFPKETRTVIRVNPTKGWSKIILSDVACCNRAFIAWKIAFELIPKW